MTVGRQARRIEAVGNVLKFPVPSSRAAGSRPSLKIYYFAGAVLLLAALGGTSAVLWSLSQNSALGVIAPSGEHSSDPGNRQTAVPVAARHHQHVRARERPMRGVARASADG
jgi:hypothetical protein